MTILYILVILSPQAVTTNLAKQGENIATGISALHDFHQMEAGRHWRFGTVRSYDVNHPDR